MRAAPSLSLSQATRNGAEQKESTAMTPRTTYTPRHAADPTGTLTEQSKARQRQIALQRASHVISRTLPEAAQLAAVLYAGPLGQQLATAV